MNNLKLDFFLIELNPAELKCYPYVITLDKYNENCNIITEISDRIRVQNKAKDVNLSGF